MVGAGAIRIRFDCARMGLKTVIGGFVDDISILAYGLTTEGNCQIIERTHRACENWAKTHGASFAPHKYELIHLARAPRRFNISASVDITRQTVKATPTLKILRLHINGKLKWGPHLQKVKGKMETQILGLTALAKSTWGATLNKAR